MDRPLRPSLPRPAGARPGASGVATLLPAVCVGSSSPVVTVTSAGATPVGATGPLAGSARAARARRTVCLAALAEALGDPAAEARGAAATSPVPAAALSWLDAALPGSELEPADPPPAGPWASPASGSGEGVAEGAGARAGLEPPTAPVSASGSAAASVACPAFSRARSPPSGPGRRDPIRRSLSAVACRRGFIAQTPTNNWPGKDRKARSHQERRWHRSAW